ncbi:hypothetical protein [Chryseobacterium soldanellicola]|uniref:hypothetical protein n=1 Tax=Chryseobacterium soldanellicola TaxID=311333 RepID=UPI000A9E681D|nr:hypothetical protein [Chryseobacterium soldanellicola]
MYGQSHYDFDDGVMFFIAQNQVFGIEKIEEIASNKSGWVLMIHPDFLWNTSLGKNISHYEFFDYAVNEGLFLSEREDATLNTIVKNLEQEYNANIDKFSQSIIVSQLETMLNYSKRFYQRQFLTCALNTHSILATVEKTIEDFLMMRIHPGAFGSRCGSISEYISYVFEQFIKITYRCDCATAYSREADPQSQRKIINY